MSLQSLLTMTAPLRDTFHINYHDLGPSEKTPKAVFVGGIHGNELNTIFVLSRLANFLSTQTLLERVLIIPAVNVLGVNTQRRYWPFDNTDINRMFPGYAAGETTQRIAAAVFDLTKAATYRVDLHASNGDFEELPQVRLYNATDQERLVARYFDLPAVIERHSNPIVTSTIGQTWRSVGGLNFVLQAGMAGYLQTEHCESLFHSLVTFLTLTKILSGVQLAPPDAEVHFFGPSQSATLISSEAGLFVSKLKVGKWVQVQETIGSIYDGFSGELRKDVVAPVAGLLSGLRRQPLLYEGDLIARIQSRTPVQGFVDPVDTYSGRSQ